jgi:hypothetical protein
MRTKVALTSVAALLAGTVFAVAQTQQPGGRAPEAPPQGAGDVGSQRGSSVPNQPKMNPGTTGQSRDQRGPEGTSKQPGGISPEAPPQGQEPNPPRSK